MLKIVLLKPHITLQVRRTDIYKVLVENNIPEHIAKNCQKWAETATENDTYNEENFDVYVS